MAGQSRVDATVDASIVTCVLKKEICKAGILLLYMNISFAQTYNIRLQFRCIVCCSIDNREGSLLYLGFKKLLPSNYGFWKIANVPCLKKV